MQRIYLHIGQHKTGTTAIQDFCTLNRDLLLKSGFLYPKTGIHINAQHQLSWVVKNRLPAWIKREFPHFLKKTSREKLYNQFKHEAQRTDANCIIISSETFYLDVRHDLLKELLSDFDVKVIVYIRRQDQLIQSIYIQAMKDYGLRVTTGPLQCQQCTNYSLDHYQNLKGWRNYFGEENITVRVYEKNRLKNGNLIEDFAQVCKIDGVNKFRIPQRDASKRLHITIVDLLKTIYASDILDEELPSIVDSLLGLNKKLIRNSHFTKLNLLTLEESALIMNKYRASNEKVARQYLGWEHGKLFQDE